MDGLHVTLLLLLPLLRMVQTAEGDDEAVQPQTHLLGGGPPHPAPPKQTAVQQALMRRVQAAAPSDSAAATHGIVQFLDSPAFRAHLRVCCPSVAGLRAPALYARFKAEISTMEMVHNWDPRPNDSEFDELNLTVWGGYGYDINLWQMSYLGLKEASFLWNCDKAEVGLMGFPPFQNVTEGSGDLPHTWVEACDRPTYTALNIWRNSIGNPKFGPVAVVFSPEYVANCTLLLPVDSGLWEAECNRSSRQTAASAAHMWTGWGPMACEAWPRTNQRPLLGTLQHFDHIATTWLRGQNTTAGGQGIWQPAYPQSIPQRLFERLFGEREMKLTEPEGVSGQLYWEAQIAGSVLFPHGVKMLVGQFEQLFGTSTGTQLRHLAARHGWVLGWALGNWNATQEAGGGGRHHHGGGGYEPQPATEYELSGRVLDPLPLLGGEAAPCSAGRNLTLGATTSTRWAEAWSTAAAARARGNASRGSWVLQWRALQAAAPASLVVAALRAGQCASANACVGVGGGGKGKCVCYADRP